MLNDGGNTIIRHSYSHDDRVRLDERVVDFKIGRGNVVTIASSPGEHCTHTEAQRGDDESPELQARALLCCLLYRYCRCKVRVAARLLLKFRGSVDLHRPAPAEHPINGTVLERITPS